MRFSARHLLVAPAAFAALSLGGAAIPAFAADPPPAVKPAPPADTKATPIRFTLQLVRIEEGTNLVIGNPVKSDVVDYGPFEPVSAVFIVDPMQKAATLRATAHHRAMPNFGVVQINARKQTILASPILTTLDDSTATIAVAGDDLSYTLSLSPNIAANGKILTLWNIRLSGKSLPGATAVTATGATKIDAGKPAVIAEISLTDPVSGHRATFVLQGTTLTGDAATETAPPASPAATPVPAALATPATPATPAPAVVP